jgi:4a-hydroxytetrahydrobiopterin dehydratase
MGLAEKKCVACEGGVAPLNRVEAEVLLRQVRDWVLSPDGKTITKRFKLKNFKEAMALANAIGDVAEEEGHHPDLAIGWGKVEVALTTHAIDGLSENDFILAAKIDAIS